MNLVSAKIAEIIGESQKSLSKKLENAGLEPEDKVSVDNLIYWGVNDNWPELIFDVIDESLLTLLSLYYLHGGSNKDLLNVIQQNVSNEEFINAGIDRRALVGMILLTFAEELGVLEDDDISGPEENLYDSIENTIDEIVHHFGDQVLDEGLSIKADSSLLVPSLLEVLGDDENSAHVHGLITVLASTEDTIEPFITGSVGVSIHGDVLSYDNAHLGVLIEQQSADVTLTLTIRLFSENEVVEVYHACDNEIIERPLFYVGNIQMNEDMIFGFSSSEVATANSTDSSTGELIVPEEGVVYRDTVTRVVPDERIINIAMDQDQDHDD